MTERIFAPDGEVLRSFLGDRESFVKLILGPPGSGKSSGCAMDGFMRSNEQVVSPLTGKRMSKGIVVRATEAELKTTTIPTWLSWFPESEMGRFYWSSPFTHEIRYGDIELDVLFWSVEHPDKVAKLDGFEVTWAWINEARELPVEVIWKLSKRLRYPSMEHGGPTRPGILCDTNAPAIDHWWPIMAGDVKAPEWMSEEDAAAMRLPKGYRFFNQPPAVLEVKKETGETVWQVNPKAENLKNLPADYYPNMIPGKTSAYIRVELGNQYGERNHAQVVYPAFRRDLHVAGETLPVLQGVQLIGGLDYGRNPAFVMLQEHRGQVRVLGECARFGMGIRAFIRGHLKPWLHKRFPGLFVDERVLELALPGTDVELKQRLLVWGDPTGDSLPQTEETTPQEIMRAAGFDVQPAPSNDPTLRIETVAALLDELIEGRPRLLIDPSCEMLISGFNGKYHYKRKPDGHLDDRPAKNAASHVHDALQYPLLGMGLARSMVLGRGDRTATVVPFRYSPLSPNHGTSPRVSWRGMNR